MKLTQEEVIKRFKKKHGNKFDYSLVDYNGLDKKITIVCNGCNRTLEVWPQSHFMHGCKFCSQKGNKILQPSTLDVFIKKAKLVHGDKYNYFGPYINSKTKVKIKCNKCNNIFYQAPSSHIQGVGCRKCQYIKLKKDCSKTYQEFEREADSIHQGLYLYFQDYINQKTKVKILCTMCNNYFSQSPGDHLQGKGCSFCKKSKGEIRIAQWLTTNGLKYQQQKTFENCVFDKKVRFDFYVQDLNLCIEYDGKHHFEANPFFGGKKEFNILKIKDTIKNNFCQENNIRLLRIPYWDYENIEQILNKNIS